MSGINFKQLPIRCRVCHHLDCLSLYMDGSADYMCHKPACEYREKFKDAVKRAKRAKEK